MMRSPDAPAEAPANSSAASPSSGLGLAQSLSVTDWLNQGSQAVQSAISAIDSSEAATDEQRFLRFVMAGSETALLPLESIHEVSQIPSRGILPVPEMPDAVLGIANCRGAILWMVDLATFLGLNIPTSSTETASILPQKSLSLHTITVHAAGQSIGLVVPAVMDIEAHDTQSLQSPNAELFPAHLVPFLAGYLDRTCSPVLSAEALIENLQMQR